MSREVELYHISHAADIRTLTEYGLSPDCVQPCIGGQMEGIYFFSRENWAKEWMWRNRETMGEEGYICTARIPKKEIAFPEWRLDLFFNQGVIDDLVSSLKRYYGPKADEEGVVPLNLESKYAVLGSYDDDDFFFESRQSTITGLKFKGGQCLVLFAEKDMRGVGEKRLSSVMDEDFYGFADTLLDHMCQRDEKLLRQYNRRLRNNVFNCFKHGAVKYVGDQNIPVTVEPYRVWEHPMYYVSGLLLLSKTMALLNEFYEQPPYKRIPEAIREVYECYQQIKKDKEGGIAFSRKMEEIRKRIEGEYYFKVEHQAEKEEAKVLFLPSGRVPISIHTADMTHEGLTYVGLALKKESYSPEERAAFLYQAITAKKDGKYLYSYICLGGGNGAEDTIRALEELQKEKGPLPERVQDLTVIGFSDASQLHHYLGQRGIGTQVYFSGGCTRNSEGKPVPDPEKFYRAMADILTGKEKTINLKVENNPEGRQEITGITQPGSITSVEHRPTHQLQPVSGKSNFLIVELTNQVQVDRLKQVLDRLEEGADISLALSQDMSDDMVKTVKCAFPDQVILSGMPVGHGSCLEKGEPIPLFAGAKVVIHGDEAMMVIDPRSSEEAKELHKKPKRECPKVIQEAKRAQAEFCVEGLDGAGRAIVSDMTLIRQGAKKYKIRIADAGPNYTWQRMELGVKELLEHRVIDPNKLERLDFTGDSAAEGMNWEKMTQVMTELAEWPLPKLKTITYNGQEIPFEKPKVATGKGMSGRLKQNGEGQACYTPDETIEAFVRATLSKQYGG